MVGFIDNQELCFTDHGGIIAHSTFNPKLWLGGLQRWKIIEGGLTSAALVEGVEVVMSRQGGHQTSVVIDAHIVVGVLPDAFQHKKNGFVDALVMYKQLAT